MSGEARRRREVEHLERLNLVMDKVVAGMSIREIAAELGIPKSTVHRMARSALDRYVPEQYGNRTQMLARELVLLDSLTRLNLQSAQLGDWQSARIVLQAHMRRCRLLGLDAPSRTQHTFSSAIDREIEDLVSLLGETSG